MFGNLGWGELLVLLFLGLIVFGPERLPKAASDAAKMLRELRTMARGAADDLKAELGPEMADLDLRSLHPRNLLQQAFDDDDHDDHAPASAAVGRVTTPLVGGERPPYDPDAT